MPNVVREDVDALNILLTVVIERSDYEQKLNNELKKYRQKATIKGFRKGKTPLSFIKKTYGNAVLADIVNQQIQTDLYEYLQESKMDYLGQPLPAPDQDFLDLDIKSLQDEYRFTFELGLTPDFELQGADEDTTLEEYDVEIPEKVVQDEMDLARRRHGDRGTVEDELIEDNDIVKFKAKELDGDQIKEGGWESEMSILVNRIADEAVKEEIKTKKHGDSIRFNVFTIEANETEDYAKKYLLNMDENQIKDIEVGEMFEGEIIEVTRIQPAELNEEFFEKQFGKDQVSTEEEAKAKLEEDVKSFYTRQAEGLLYRDAQENLMELNSPNIPLPDEFLKRWLVASNDQNTEENVEAGYESFAKSLRWSIIRNKLQQKFDIKIEEADLRKGFGDRIRQYMGGVGDETYIDTVIDRMMEDQKQVENLAEELFSDRLFEQIKGAINVKPKAISIEDFTDVIQKAREEAAAIREGVVVQEEE